jgi:hypothetical protein
MTTTIELPDPIYNQVKAHAALQGTTVDAYLVEVIREKLSDEQDELKPGLMSVFGKGDKEAVAEVQRIIDEEFSKIDPEGWK